MKNVIKMRKKHVIKNVNVIKMRKKRIIKSASPALDVNVSTSMDKALSFDVKKNKMKSVFKRK